MSLLSLVVYSVLSEERGGGSSSHVLTGLFTNALGWFACARWAWEVALELSR